MKRVWIRFFSQDNREKIKNENPDATFGEIGKHLGEAWKSLTDEEKTPYNEMAERDKQRYLVSFYFITVGMESITLGKQDEKSALGK